MLDVMTPEQVADLLQLNTETIYRLIRDKKLAAHSTMPTLRDAMFRRVMAIAERHPGLSSDDLLEELERLDEEAKDQAHARRR